MSSKSDATSVYSECIPLQGLGGLKKHPTNLCESSSLAFVSLPPVCYKTGLGRDSLSKLSNIQIETISLANQKHLELLENGQRAGFYIGDGTGVGKGRMIAGVILHNITQGRSKALWISASKMLKSSAERDLKSIGYEEPLLDVDSVGEREEGILFLTYAGLGSKTRVKKNGIEKAILRFDEITNWLGKDFEGVIAFDECHKAKKYSPNPRHSTQTGNLVVRLQNAFPLARILYCSATAAWKPAHLAYLQRLGLWGNDSFSNSIDFVDSMFSRGVDGMELLALELKMSGNYVARQLSFKGIEFECETVELDTQFRQMYDLSAEIWQLMYKRLCFMKNQGKCNNLSLSNFWSANQRFFSSICLAAKVSHVVEVVRESVSRGMAVVIGLQTTGEASYKRYCGYAKEGTVKTEIETTPFSLSRHILKEAVGALGIEIESHKLSNIDRNSSSSSSRSRSSSSSSSDSSSSSSSSSTSSSSSSCASSSSSSTSNGNLTSDSSEPKSKRRSTTVSYMSDTIITKFSALAPMLPPNPLDSLIRLLGGPDKVGEMTGRSVREHETSRGYIAKRRSRKANVKDHTLFMTNLRSIIVISDAASTGISLHEDKSYGKFNRKRLHITLELPWSADRAIQQLGRTHRANQFSAPKYLLLVSDVPAELRFTSAVAQRLQKMGALTHGDRRAGSSTMLSKFSLNVKYSRGTLRNLLNAFCGKDSVLGGRLLRNIGKQDHEIFEMLAKCGLIHEGRPAKGSYDSDKFFNRLLTTPLDDQDVLMKLFTRTFEFYVRNETFGPLDGSIRDLTPVASETRHSLELLTTREFSIRCGKVLLHKIRLDRGMSWAKVTYVTSRLPQDHFRFVTTGCGTRMRVLLTVSSDGKFKVYRPATGLMKYAGGQEAFLQGKRTISVEYARKIWSVELNRFQKLNCEHLFSSKICLQKRCEVGQRVKLYYIVSGCLTQIWNQIKESNDGRENQVVRCTLNNLKRIVGILIAESNVVKFVQDIRRLEEQNTLPITFDEAELSRSKEFSEISDVSDDESGAESEENDNNCK